MLIIQQINAYHTMVVILLRGIILIHYRDGVFSFALKVIMLKILIGLVQLIVIQDLLIIFLENVLVNVLKANRLTVTQILIHV